MYYQEEGDIIFQEEGHWRDKISRYVMSSKSLWHYLVGKRESVSYYHVCVAYGNEVIIEQKRWGIQIVNWKPGKKQIIFRSINKTNNVYVECRKYDFLNCLGHLLAWITGIQQFRYLHSKNKQNCVLMTMWHCVANCDEVFPLVKCLWEWHTHDLYKYILNNPNYKIVYKNE